MSVQAALALDRTSKVLEVGCGSGYLACGIAPRVARYIGVDISALPIEVAKRMNLTNARFLQAAGEALPFDSEAFDSAYANDVLQNFPNFDDTVPLIREMLRVVKRGGHVMIGSVADGAKAEKYHARVDEYSRWLTAQYGPLPVAKTAETGPGQGFEIAKATPHVQAEAVFHYFNYDDFFGFAQSQGICVRIEDVHPLNPYVGFRHNFIFTK